MQIINNELTVATDIDDTLVMWDNPNTPGPNKVEIEFAGKKVYLTPHTYHIDLVKMYKQRGYFVIAWSANGKDHVEKVIKALKIEEYIDIGMTKLAKHVDDSDNAAAILGPRVYCEDLTKPQIPAKIYVPKGSIPFPFDGLID